jgi:hypothetical protein
MALGSIYSDLSEYAAHRRSRASEYEMDNGEALLSDSLITDIDNAIAFFDYIPSPVSTSTDHDLPPDVGEKEIEIGVRPNDVFMSPQVLQDLLFKSECSHAIFLCLWIRPTNLRRLENNSWAETIEIRGAAEIL